MVIMSTFLVGPRRCIRNVFAKVEFKCLIGAVIGRFKLDGKREGLLRGG